MNTEELTNKLIQDIEQEKYKYAQAIPSERDFVQIYEMNRSAVKKAIQQLVNKEYLLKVHGKGTFVKKISMNICKSNFMVCLNCWNGKGFSLAA